MPILLERIILFSVIRIITVDHVYASLSIAAVDMVGTFYKFRHFNSNE